MNTVLFKKPKLWETPQPDSAVYARMEDKTNTLRQRLSDIVAQHSKVKLASSLAVEDMVITDVVAHINAPVEVFTLQTGRLNAETVALSQAVQQRYPRLAFQLYHPHAQAVADYQNTHGENAFYNSVEMRRLCCEIRKVEPLNRALANADAWITGQRRQQSVTRSELAFAEHDKARNISKYNPIFDWSELEVWAYILQNNVPFNALYSQGYPSIGCEPCTIPVKLGEDIRSGRWFWENRDSKECGLHQ